ncbi:beta-ketoacyl synthase N-terminal-like domain-containing protein, partial [Streptomyces huiliensis]|uniref:beta-ketoacyl synthase N-terminal-like domain-containing protein n=1 Tax=Streptomyces huiliensis TaxID=2876027 RepID=UPI001CBD836F
MTSTAPTECTPPHTTGPAVRPFEPVAVVGRGCVLPGALTPGAFWENVAAGRSALGPLPAGHWRLPVDAARVPDGGAVIPTDTGGYVHGFADVFDPTGFALDPADIGRFDPLFHWVLHAGREALREAGHPGPAPRRTGLVLGTLAHPTDAAMRHAEHVWTCAQDPAVRDALLRQAPPAPDPVNRFCAGLPALVAAR